MSLDHNMNSAIIIGAGIAGCSTAHALAQRGINVHLIERHASIAQEASGNPVAMLYPKFNAGANFLSAIASHGFKHTLALLAQLQTKDAIYKLCGQIQLAFNEQEHKKQLSLLASPQQKENLQLLSAAAASEKANIQLNTGGLYLPESGWVKPKAFCTALAQSPLITTLVSTKAINIQTRNNTWQVLLENNQLLEADIVVLCNANDINCFGFSQHIPITPVRGQVNFFTENDLSKQIKTIICSDHYVSPSVDGLHSVGTSYAPNNLNAAISSADTQANLHALEKISPVLFQCANLSQLSGRVAWRSATKDYMPLAGQLINEQALRKAQLRYNDSSDKLPWLKGLYVNAGHGSKGIITAPLCGELIANLITHETLAIDKTIAAKLNPSRFLLRDLGLKEIAQNLY